MEPATSLRVVHTQSNTSLALTLPADVWKTIWLFTGHESSFVVARCVCQRLKAIFSEESVIIETYRLRVNCLWSRNFPLWQVYIDRNVVPDPSSEVVTKLMVKQVLECREDFKNITPLLNSNASEFIRIDQTRNAAFQKEAVLQSAIIAHDPEEIDFIRDNPHLVPDFKQFLIDKLIRKEPKMIQWFNAAIRSELIEIALNQALTGNASLLKWLACRGLTLQQLQAFCVVINLNLTDELLAKVFPPIHVLPLKLIAKITSEVPNPIPLNFVCKTFNAALKLDFRSAILKNFNWGQRCYHLTLMQLAIDQAEKGQLQLLEWFINKQFSFKPLFQDDKTRALNLLRLSVTQMLQGNVAFRLFLQRFATENLGEKYLVSTDPFCSVYAWAIQKQCQTGLIADEALPLFRLPGIMARFNTENEAQEYRIRMENHPYLAWVESLGCDGYLRADSGARFTPPYDLHFAPFLASFLLGKMTHEMLHLRNH